VDEPPAERQTIRLLLNSATMPCGAEMDLLFEQVADGHAGTVPGVRVALGRSTHTRLAALAEQATFKHRHPHAAVGVLGRTAVVDLAVAVQYGDPVHEIARTIQQQVIKSLRENVGLQTVHVNVNVDDILTDDQ
jgi:uncharacterized alkaline shock family protein YloU